MKLSLFDIFWIVSAVVCGLVISGTLGLYVTSEVVPRTLVIDFDFLAAGVAVIGYTVLRFASRKLELLAPESSGRSPVLRIPWPRWFISPNAWLAADIAVLLMAAGALSAAAILFCPLSAIEMACDEYALIEWLSGQRWLKKIDLLFQEKSLLKLSYWTLHERVKDVVDTARRFVDPDILRLFSVCVAAPTALLAVAWAALLAVEERFLVSTPSERATKHRLFVVYATVAVLVVLVPVSFLVDYLGMMGLVGGDAMGTAYKYSACVVVAMAFSLVVTGLQKDDARSSKSTASKGRAMRTGHLANTIVCCVSVCSTVILF
jgi:hypothetical protein